MAHTPGPWKFDEPDNWYGLQARVCTEDSKPIAQVQLSGWPKKIGLSNAALIATAPELLAYAEISEALGEYHRDGSGFTIEMTLAVLTKHGYVPENPDFPGMGAGTWGRNFRKRVIAKAKGN